MQEIQSLKNKILMLAIQSKLVPQMETEEPASVLLQKIQQEKEKLIQEKKLKKEKNKSIIYKKGNQYFEKIGDIEKNITENIPFEIPENWQWVRLGSLLKKIGSGSTPKGGRNIYTTRGIKFIRSQNVHNNGLQLKDIVYITNEINNQKKNSIVLANDVLLNITGASIGRCAVVPSDFDLANINQHIMILRLFSTDLRFWIHLVIISKFIQSVIMAVQNGSSKEALTIDKINQFLIPLPPLEEQKRITQKVQELFALIDVIEKNKQELDDLKTALKNKILSLAIQGKLVPQTETDEPVSNLLQKIQLEKEKLIKEKKIKKDIVFSTIYEKDNHYHEKIGDIEKDITKEIPFEIPKTWQWIRLGDIAQIYTGNSISDNNKINKYHNKNIGYNFIATKDVSFNNTINYQTDIIIPYNEPNFKTCDNGAVLLCIEGGSAGKKVALVRKKICFGNKLCSFTLYQGNAEYLFYLLQSQYFKSIFVNNITGLIGGVSGSKIAEFLFPLPPLEEQHRIAQKIEEVFALYEKL